MSIGKLQAGMRETRADSSHLLLPCKFRSIMSIVLKRISVIVWAYFLAVMAGVVTPIFVGGVLGFLAGGREPLSDALRMGFLALGWFAAPIAFISAVPAAVLIVIAERYRIRSRSYYVLAAISVCVLLAVVAAFLFETWEQSSAWLIYAVPSVGIFGLIFGPIIGSVYWHIAGRSAGEACCNHDTGADSAGLS